MATLYTGLEPVLLREGMTVAGAYPLRQLWESEVATWQA